MSREIKFRAWDDAIIHIMPQMVGPFMIKDSVLASYANINAPLMQYTGLKDKNGVEIYEGDIMKDKRSGSPDISYVVNWGGKDNLAAFVLGNDWSPLNEHDCTVVYEVIGNIYENSELLEANQ